MVVASMPRQAPHGSDELAAADDAPRSEHNGTVPVLHATNPEMPFWASRSRPTRSTYAIEQAARRWRGG